MCLLIYIYISYLLGPQVLCHVEIYHYDSRPGIHVDTVSIAFGMIRTLLRHCSGYDQGNLERAGASPKTCNLCSSQIGTSSSTASMDLGCVCFGCLKLCYHKIGDSSLLSLLRSVNVVIYIYMYIYIYTGLSINGVPPNGLFIRGNPNLKWMIFLVYPYSEVCAWGLSHLGSRSKEGSI